MEQPLWFRKGGERKIGIVRDRLRGFHFRNNFLSFSKSIIQISFQSEHGQILTTQVLEIPDVTLLQLTKTIVHHKSTSSLSLHYGKNRFQLK